MSFGPDALVNEPLSTLTGQLGKFGIRHRAPVIDHGNLVRICPSSLGQANGENRRRRAGCGMNMHYTSSACKMLSFLSKGSSMTDLSGAPLQVAPIENDGLLLDRVVDALRAAILAGSIAPGTRLSVPELARQLNVSRTPAREALQRLQHEGLVSMTPRRGAEVLGGRPGDLRELFEFREALEGMAARLAATRMTAQEKDRLGEEFEAHAAAVRRSDLFDHIEHDQEFHEIFIAGARNKRIADELARVRSQLTVITRTMSAVPGALSRPVIDVHKAMLDAILAGDGRAAEIAARSHVRGILDFYLNHPEQSSAGDGAQR